MSQEQQEQVLQNSEPQAVDVTVNVGGDLRAERFLGTFDQISRLSLDIDRNYGNKLVLNKLSTRAWWLQVDRDDK